jgi:hypothetical protein
VTMPDVLWRVVVSDQTQNGEIVNLESDGKQPLLWVPRLDTWTLDTLRMVLHELAAFLPANEPEDAKVVIVASPQKRRGRARAGSEPGTRTGREREARR